MTVEMLEDGYQTLITFEDFPEVELEEIEVTPPSMSAGGPVETKTMRRSRVRTKAPKKLLTLGEMKLTVAYNPAIYTTMQSMIGHVQKISALLPDGQTVDIYGWVEEFTPGNLTEGERPTAELTIHSTGWNADKSDEYMPTVTAS